MAKMQITGLISWRHTTLLLFVSACAVLAPYIFLYHSLGEAPTLPTGAFNTDGGYYSERIEEVADGHPLLGNPYFFEHRNDLPPAFFLADWFAAVPLVLGLPLMDTTLLDLFVWSFIFLLLAYFLLRTLEVSPWVSVIGSVLVFSSVYLHVTRIVSMQEVYPFALLFLIAFAYWLKKPDEHKRIYITALTAALTAYIYTYAWQVVVVTLCLTPIAFYATGRREYLRSFLSLFGIFALASLPLVLFTLAQIHNPFYWETMQRIGLVNTHLPASAVVSSCIWIPAMFLLWFVLSRSNSAVSLRKQSGNIFLFFILTGLAMVAVTLSNIITGKDLELPQHIERFTIIWLSLASIYSCYFFFKHKPEYPLRRWAWVCAALCIGLIIFGNMRYLLIYGPLHAFDPIDSTHERQMQELAKPLAWINEHVPEQSVVWTDPHGGLNSYLSMMTHHYTLFRPSGLLHLASNDELAERYLIANYFALTETDLENDYWAYGGVGNAMHQWKTHNREVLVCRIIHLDRLGYHCGELTDRVSWKGKTYFTTLYDKYEGEIKPNIVSELKKYHVAYIMHDNAMDTPTFHPEFIPGTELIYTDGRVSIYHLQ